ncbi:hypothetical protein [Blastococcus sp. CT_GayMR20]|nr:hypothetical protein [Blastococcus sp. CT_GayMR20]
MSIVVRKTRAALAQGSVVIACSISCPNGSMPVVGAVRPITRAAWTS